MFTRSAKLFAFTLLLLYAISILGWHAVDTRPSSMDETRHMKLAYDYQQWLGKGVPLTNEWSHVYPPVYHLSILPAVSLGVPSEGKVAATHLIYLLIFMAGCVLIGRQMGLTDLDVVLGAILSAGYCYVIWASRRALIDFPLMAWVTLSIALLARTKGFTSRKNSLLWGVSAGIGLLIKPPFIFFMVGPFLWVLISGFREAQGRRQAILRNMLYAVGVTLAISLPWYFWQGAYFIDKASRLASEPQAEGTHPHTLAGWFYYARILSMQMGASSLAFTLAGIVLAMIRRARNKGLLIVWFVSGYVILSALVNKDPRHTLSLLPALALLSVQGWGSLFAERRPSWAIVILAPLLLVYNIWTYDRPAREDWKHDEALTYLAQQHDPHQPLLLVSILSHQARFFSRTLKWSAIQRGMEFSPVSPGDSDVSFPEFILRRPGNQGSETGFIDSQWQKLLPDSRAFKDVFFQGPKLDLLDGTQIFIYQRSPHPQFRVSPLTTHELERRITLALSRRIQGPLIVDVIGRPQAMAEGHLDRVHLSCLTCSIQGVPIQRLDVVIEKPWLNLYRLWDEGRLGLLAFESLKPGLTVSANNVKAPLSRVKGLTEAEVHMEGGRLIVQGRFKGIPVKAVAQVNVDSSAYPHVEAVLDRVFIAGIPLPGWILGKAHRQFLPLYPIPDFPGRIIVDQITIDQGMLQIN